MDSNTHPLLYDKLENLIAVLDLAFNVKETNRLKNEWTLDFNYPYDDAGKWALLDTECIVEVKGEKYVLKVVEPEDSQGGIIIACQGEHVSTQTIDYFIDPADDTTLSRTSYLLGVTAQTALTNALKGSRFTLGSVTVPGVLTTTTAAAIQGAMSITVQSVTGFANGNVIQIGSTQATISSISGSTINFNPGLYVDMPLGTPVGINVHDINMQERNLTDVLKEIEKTWNGELSWSNRTVSFVSQIGQSNGVVFRHAKNNAKIKRTTDSRNLCTRLYGYGAGGLTIESINSTKYLDSQYINNYPKPLAVKKDYSNIADPESLYQAMKADLALLEKPQVTYELSVVELSKLTGYPYGDLEKYGLGDYVTVIDERLNNASLVSRINQYERYPYEPELSTLQIESLLSTTYDQMATAHSGVNSLFSTVNISPRRNNRPIGAVANPTAPTQSISYLSNTDGSVNLLVQWNFTEDPTSPIDGFGVVIHTDTTSTAYQFPTSITADANGTYDKTIRGVEFNGIPADKYYTVAVYTFRYVDQDIQSSGLIKSKLWYTNSGNPYQPSSSVAFAGNVTGNIAGTSATTVRDQAANSIQSGTLYNGVKMDPTDGILVTRSDNKVQTLLNATDGIKIQQWNGTTWTNEFYTDINGNIYFSGSLNGATGTFTGAVNGGSFNGGTIAIGSGNSIFKADSNGIYLGNASFGSAPFHVDMAGNVTASNVNITGGSITGASSINVSSDLNVGRNIVLSQGATSFSTSIQLINNNVYLTADPSTNAMHLTAAGGVYAGSQRLDVAQTFVWG